MGLGRLMWDEARALRVAVTRSMESDHAPSLPGLMAGETGCVLASQTLHQSLRGQEGYYSCVPCARCLVTAAFQQQKLTKQARNGA